MDTLQQQIADLRLQKTSPKGLSGGMPRSATTADLSGYAARLDELVRRLEEASRLSVELYAEIDAAIARSTSRGAREILRRRYLLGQGWDEIAQAVGCSYRSITRQHGRALQSFNPETDKKCLTVLPT